MENNVKFCSSCWEKIENISKFCTNCGNNLTWEKNISNQNNTNIFKKSRIWSKNYFIFWLLIPFLIAFWIVLFAIDLEVFQQNPNLTLDNYWKFTEENKKKEEIKVWFIIVTFFIYNFFMTIKRLHDLNISWKKLFWYLIVFIPLTWIFLSFFLFIISNIYLSLKYWTSWENQYWKPE